MIKFNESHFLNKWFDKKNHKTVSKILKELDASLISVKKVQHSIEIDREKLFGNIDDTIKLLEQLKKDGFTGIEENWIGYEDNEFCAYKIEDETEEELEQRLFHTVQNIIFVYEEEERRRDEIKRKIADKQKELNELKKQLK